MRKVVAYPAMLASAVGMLLCVFSYLGWLTGSYRFPRPEPPLLFIGIFVVWLPTVLLLNTLTRDFKQKDLWKAANIYSAYSRKKPGRRSGRVWTLPDCILCCVVLCHVLHNSRGRKGRQ